MIRFAETAIVILAAGSSSRMGVTKQLLEWNGDSLISIAIGAARQIAPENTLVVLGADHEQVYQSVKDAQVETVVNQDWKMGMGSSISVGVNFVRTYWPEKTNVIIMLADQPLIDSHHLRKLLELHNRSDCEMAATAYDDKPGVPAIFSSKYFDALMEFNSDYGARQLLQSICKRSCMVSGDGKITDIDTMDDYKKFIRSNPRS